MISLPAWPCFFGEPAIRGRIKVCPEDFRVQEIPLIEPCGEGSHLWLELEKRGANTNWVAGQLASAAGVPVRDVGFAGMKDRHGVTSQWFSVALQEAGNPDWNSWEVPDVTILNASHHTRKLKRGALKGNRFQIAVRDLEGDTGDLELRLERVSATGVPNYYGPQRFGFNGSNVERGLHALKKRSRLSRNKRSIYISALRSFLFNEVLARRVPDGSWNRILDGEMAMLDGSHSVFCCTMPDAVLSQRCDEFDIHPSGPLPGNGGMQPERQAADIEQEVLSEYANILEVLTNAGARADRRALRLVPGNLTYEVSGQAMNLAFDLPPGNYATSLLRELGNF